MARILVVDDETALVELVRSYLEREQYEVLTAADERTALELARAEEIDKLLGLTAGADDYLTKPFSW